MKTKIGIVILLAICIGLAIALIETKNSTTGRTKNAETIIDFSNQLVAANASLDDLRQVNLMLTNDIAASQRQLTALSNNFTETADTLAETKTSLQSAQSQIVNLNSRIGDLESQNQTLDQRAAELTNTIASLNSQIAETEKKLATSQTNNSFLSAELQKELAQRAELERKFNDIQQVKAQFKKLRDEEFVARRLRWMRAGNYSTEPRKGAEILMQHASEPIAEAAPPSNYNLNVEVTSEGAVRILTNAPATNPPAR
ncbi:MAG: hypothetical protein ACREFE_05555 [Limisphaerales bacterium]